MIESNYHPHHVHVDFLWTSVNVGVRNRVEQEEMYSWIIENVKSLWSLLDMQTFLFKDQEDAVFFRLKFGVN